MATMARWGRKERQQPAEEEISMIKMDAFHFFESPRPIDFDFRREFATFLTTGFPATISTSHTCAT